MGVWKWRDGGGRPLRHLPSLAMLMPKLALASGPLASLGRCRSPERRLLCGTKWTRRRDGEEVAETHSRRAPDGPDVGDHMDACGPADRRHRGSRWRDG